MLVLLQAARYENYNNVTTSLVNVRRRFSVPSTPPPLQWRIAYSQSTVITTYLSRSSIYNNAADVFSSFAKCYILTAQYSEPRREHIAYGRRNFPE